MFPRLLDGRTTANRRQRRDAKPRAPQGQPSYRMRSIQVLRHRGAKSESRNSDPRTCDLENLLLLPRTSLRPPSGGWSGAAPRSRLSDFWRTPTRRNMEQSNQSPNSQKLAAVNLTRTSSFGPALLSRRRSPLIRLDIYGGHENPSSRPCLPLERSRSEVSGAGIATLSLTSIDRRGVCGDGLSRRAEEMRVCWIRGDRFIQYVTWLGRSSEPRDAEGCLLAT
jgi:hypothetical protein